MRAEASPRRVARAAAGYFAGSNSARNFLGGLGAYIRAAVSRMLAALTKAQRPVAASVEAMLADRRLKRAAAVLIHSATFHCGMETNHSWMALPTGTAAAMAKISMLRAARSDACAHIIRSSGSVNRPFDKFHPAAA